jgi:hypothetical protein
MRCAILHMAKCERKTIANRLPMTIETIRGGKRKQRAPKKIEVNAHIHHTIMYYL